MVSKKFEKRINKSLYKINGCKYHVFPSKGLIKIYFKQQKQLREKCFEIKKLEDKYEVKDHLNVILKRRIESLEKQIKLYMFLIVILLINTWILLLFI